MHEVVLYRSREKVNVLTFVKYILCMYKVCIVLIFLLVHILHISCICIFKKRLYGSIIIGIINFMCEKTENVLQYQIMNLEMH